MARWNLTVHKCDRCGKQVDELGDAHMPMGWDTVAVIEIIHGVHEWERITRQTKEDKLLCEACVHEYVKSMAEFFGGDKNE